MNIIFKKRIDSFDLTYDVNNNIVFENLLRLSCDILKWESKIIGKKIMRKIKQETLKYWFKKIYKLENPIVNYLHDRVKIIIYKSLIGRKYAFYRNMIENLEDVLIFNIGARYKQIDFKLIKWFSRYFKIITSEFLKDTNIYDEYFEIYYKNILNWDLKKISMEKIYDLFDGDRICLVYSTVYTDFGNIGFNYFRTNVYCNYMKKYRSSCWFDEI
jgi:hypothetical protein